MELSEGSNMFHFLYILQMYFILYIVSCHIYMYYVYET